jgi:thiol-disulfide isomerase/thioredoxin
MHIKKVLLILLFLYFGIISLNAQEISIGEKCPDVELKNIINYNQSSIKISQFRGKLVIIDFWATWCGGCISMLPKTDSLQKVFFDKVVFIPVTYQDSATVKFFLKKMQNVKHFMPWTVTGDTILKKMFKHTFIPHYVWINQQGIVFAITGSQEVTYSNVFKALEGKAILVEEKKDKNKLVDPSKALFVEGKSVIINKQVSIDTVSEEGILYRSILTKYQEGLPSFSSQDSIRFTASNRSILSLYMAALGRFTVDFSNANRVILELDDTMKIMYPERLYKDINYYKSWMKENTYCYEIKTALATVSEKRYDLMLDDLNKYFGATMGIFGTIERRNVKCLVLNRITSEDKLTSRGGNSVQEENKFFFKLKNKPLKSLMIKLVYYYMQTSSMPLLDETNFKENVDLEINADLTNLSAVNKELEKYGLKFIESNRIIDMIIIKNKSTLVSKMNMMEQN